MREKEKTDDFGPQLLEKNKNKKFDDSRIHPIDKLKRHATELFLVQTQTRSRASNIRAEADIPESGYQMRWRWRWSLTVSGCRLVK